MRYVSHRRPGLMLVRHGAVETCLGLSIISRGTSRPYQSLYGTHKQIPAFLFATLSFCFYFTYFQVGASNVAPTSYVSLTLARLLLSPRWPAIWLVFVAVLFLNPLPFFRRDSRYWFLRVLLRVITPGYSRVEVHSLPTHLSRSMLIASLSLSSSPMSSTRWSTRYRTSTFSPVGTLTAGLATSSKFVQLERHGNTHYYSAYPLSRV
jgi:hypothetical protein